MGDYELLLKFLEESEKEITPGIVEENFPSKFFPEVNLEGERRVHALDNLLRDKGYNPGFLMSPYEVVFPKYDIYSKIIDEIKSGESIGRVIGKNLIDKEENDLPEDLCFNNEIYELNIEKGRKWAGFKVGLIPPLGYSFKGVAETLGFKRNNDERIRAFKNVLVEDDEDYLISKFKEYVMGASNFAKEMNKKGFENRTIMGSVKDLVGVLVFQYYEVNPEVNNFSEEINNLLISLSSSARGISYEAYDYWNKIKRAGRVTKEARRVADDTFNDFKLFNSRAHAYWALPFIPDSGSELGFRCILSFLKKSGNGRSFFAGRVVEVDEDTFSDGEVVTYDVSTDDLWNLNNMEDVRFVSIGLLSEELERKSVVKYFIPGLQE